MRVAAFGHSHLTGLMSAYNKKLARGEVGFEMRCVNFIGDVQSQYVVIDGCRQFNPEAVNKSKKLLEHQLPDLAVLILQGNQPVMAGLTHEQVFDFMDSTDTEIDADERPNALPYDMIVTHFEETYGLIDKFLDDNRLSFPYATFALSPPPPVGDAAFMMKKLAHLPVHAKLQASGLPTAGFRARLWRASMDAYMNVHARHAVGSMKTPRAAFSEDGCLAPEFWSDAIHAKDAYYSLLLDQISDLVYNKGLTRQ